MFGFTFPIPFLPRMFGFTFPITLVLHYTPIFTKLETDFLFFHFSCLIFKYFFAVSFRVVGPFSGRRLLRRVCLRSAREMCERSEWTQTTEAEIQKR
jgi:hypothetical protein